MRKIFLFFSVLLLLSSTLKAQNRTITGVVTGEKNETLPGVTIQVKGSNVSTATDIDGKYSIKATNLQTVVIGVKYIGYSYQEKSLKIGEMNADFKLTPTASDLNEVVVVGYGETKKGSLTGSVSVVDLKKVEDIPALSITALLRGTVPGLSISGGFARPGQPTTVTIRSPISFAKDGPGSGPLFVIDDVIRTQADFDSLDPTEVENVSVLKDAEAAIYGVQGGNGVIIIRTKRGKQGAAKFSFSSSLGLADATQLPKMMSSVQLATFDNDYNNTNVYQQTVSGVPNLNYINADGYTVTGATGAVGTTRNAAWYTPDEMDYFNTVNHNYMKDAFQTSNVYREALSVSGGSDKTTYFIGGDYVNQNSNFKGINSYKYGVRATIDSRPAKGLNVMISLSDDINYNRSYWYKLNSTQESLDNDAGSLENVQPWQEYYINGNPVSMGGSLTGGYDNLNFFLVQNSNNYTGGTSYAMNILGKVTYEIPGIKGLTASINMNKNINSSNQKQYGTKFNYYKYAGTGANNHIPGGALLSITSISNGDRVRLTPTFATSYQLDAGLNYNRTFGKNTITALALVEQREQNSDAVAAEADGLVNGGLDYQTFTTGTQSSNQASGVSTLGFQAIITRLNYDYDNKYLLQLVYRADGSSRFAPGHNWGGFPAASVGWVISQENFMKKFTWIDQLKVRASVGLTGTDNTKNYQYLANYNIGTGSSGGAVFNEGDRSIAVKVNNAIPNVEANWDHFTKTDYGIDAAFLNSRLSVSADYYWSHGYGQLTTLSSSVPALIGAAIPTENYNIANVFGYEISVGWRDHIKKLTYSFTPFLQWNDNKGILIDIASGNIGGPLDLTGKSNDPGSYGYRSLGIIRTQAEADAVIASRLAAAGGTAGNVKILGLPVQPGMINYQDVNNDGIIDAKDLQYLNSKTGNHHSMGLNFSVGYAGVNLNVIAGLSWGGVTTVDGLKPFQQGSGSTAASIADNRPVYWVDHWTPANTNAAYPNPYFAADYQVTTDFWLRSATSLNISSANLSYTLPTKLTTKAGMSSIRLYVVTTNLLQLINPYPDHYQDFATSLYKYPSLRTISFGLTVGF